MGVPMSLGVRHACSARARGGAGSGGGAAHACKVQVGRVPGFSLQLDRLKARQVAWGGPRRACHLHGAAAVGIGAGSSRFRKKDAKLAKERAFLKMVSETETEALVFLRRYIREEFETLKDKFAEVDRNNNQQAV